MAKSTDDVILRDRMQFDLSAAGDRTTLYGRVDLSNYVNPITRAGLAIKEIFFQLRDSGADNMPLSGIFNPIANWGSASTTSGVLAGLKLYATTRAYENASEVGIASPDVLAVEEYLSYVGPANSGAQPNDNGTTISMFHNRYGPKDLHPSGFIVVSDLLVGIAVDSWENLDNDTLEIDILIIAEPIKVTEGRMNEILSQAQDL